MASPETLLREAQESLAMARASLHDLARWASGWGDIAKADAERIHEAREAVRIAIERLKRLGW